MAETGAANHLHAQQGESGITAVFGVGMFLILLLLAAQVLLYLHASSVVATAAFDAASIAAGRGSGPPTSPGARSEAEQRAGSLLGSLDDRRSSAGSTYVWSVAARAGGSEEVALTITVPYPSVVAGGLGLGDISRTARVGVEQVQP